MEFTEALQEFLFHQGFQRIKYDSKILWGKDANGKLSLLEIVPPVLPGQKKISLFVFPAFSVNRSWVVCVLLDLCVTRKE